jgi:hypothetical protein
MRAIDHPRALSRPVPNLHPREQADFRRAHDTLSRRAQLVRSLRRQQRARLIIRAWRTIHISIASAALLIIAYHSILELLAYVLNIPFFQRFG